MSVILTRNRRRFLSARESAEGLALRLHESFATAPEPVLRAVAFFVDGKRPRDHRRRQALATMRDYFARHGPSPETVPRPRRLVLQPVGRAYDLRRIRDRINDQYFAGALSVRITWGRGRPARRRGRCRSVSIQLGSYVEADNLVRIHPALDHPDVPSYVVASVVHHEMLHAALPPVKRGGRRVVHSAELRRRERAFPDFERAERWIRRNLQRLTVPAQSRR